MLTPEQIAESVAYIRSKGITSPRVGVVLGTGLNNIVQYIKEPIELDYQTIPHFPQSTVSFHQGKLIFGWIENTAVVVMQGRFHYYEGYSMQQITFPIRVMKELGIQYLLLSNASGSMNPEFKKGDLIITEDHLNFLPDNPLRGLGDEWGNRFVDMSCPYNLPLQTFLQEAMEEEGLIPKKGVYVAVMGPNLETRAEYRFLRNSGADMVGMSTVPEVIVANQLGIACAAVSVITDECDPDHLKPVNIAEIIEAAAAADKNLSKVLVRVVRRLDRR